MTLPLHGWKVAVLRSLEQSHSLITRLETYGAEVISIPTIRIVPPTDLAQLHHVASQLSAGTYEWVVFTSANAVRCVAEHMTDPLSPQTRVATVGRATARVAQQYHLDPVLQPPVTKQNALGLLEVFESAASWPEDHRKILVPHANIAPSTLVDGLKAQGWVVDDIIGYRTIVADPPPPSIHGLLTTGQITAICITSGSTIRNLVTIAGPPHPQTLLACIGPSAAAATKKLGLKVAVVPEVSEAEALADALAAYAQQKLQP